MDLNYILDNINYDVLFEDGTTISGNIDYVSHHFTDGIVKANVISTSQQPDIAKFLNEYNNYIQQNEYVSIIDFYKMRSN